MVPAALNERMSGDEMGLTSQEGERNDISQEEEKELKREQTVESQVSPPQGELYFRLSQADKR